MKRKALSPGTRINPYLVSREIGQDFFGMTYLVTQKAGEDPKDNRLQAREFYPASLSMRRFGKVYSQRREVKPAFMAAREKCGELYQAFEAFETEGMVQCLDHFEANNTHFLVAEWPEGATLAEKQQEYGNLSPEQARVLLDGILPAIEALHEHGLVHGSLSADTVFRDEDGKPVINLPIAPAFAGQKPIINVPAGSETASTAPEWMAGGDEEEKISPAADIYSIGAMMTHLLTGAAPAAAKFRVAAEDAGEPDPVDWADLEAVCKDDPTLARTLKGAMSLSPEARPASVEVFRTTLIPPKPEVIAAPVEPAPVPLPKKSTRNMERWAVAAVALIGLIGLAFVLPRTGIFGGDNASGPNSAKIEKPGQEVLAENGNEVGNDRAEINAAPEENTRSEDAFAGLMQDEGAEDSATQVVVTAPEEAGLEVETPAADVAENEITAPEEEVIAPKANSEAIVPDNPKTEMAEAETPVPDDGFTARDLAAWEAAKSENSWTAYQAYLDGFGENAEQTGAYAEEAAIRLEERLDARADLIEETRGELARLGYDIASGRSMDGALSAAIMDYQKSVGLETDGDVSEALLTALSAEKTETLAIASDTETGPIKDCATCPELVRLSAGRFMMGSPVTESGRNSAESAPTSVTIDKAFAIMPYEVTLAEYRAYLQASGKPMPSGCAVHGAERAGYWASDRSASSNAPGFEQTEDHPAVCVSQNDAIAYANWMSAKTGETYRLPTSKEWEYAARAGQKAAYFWGGDKSRACENANGGDVSLTKATVKGWVVSSCDDGSAFTAPVGSFVPNRAGLYDMAGNVWEWVSDCQYEDGGNCRAYELRGGSWASSPDQLRSAKRHSAPGGARYNTVGFRLVRELN